MGLVVRGGKRGKSTRERGKEKESWLPPSLIGKETYGRPPAQIAPQRRSVGQITRSNQKKEKGKLAKKRGGV